MSKGTRIKSKTKRIYRRHKTFTAPQEPEGFVLRFCAGGGGDSARNSQPNKPSADYAEGSVLGEQVGGDHYKRMGHYQPWEVLKQWLSPEEFRGYMKGTAIAYLAREQEKGGEVDIDKAQHTLKALLEMQFQK